MKRKTLAIVMALTMVLTMVAPALASPPYPEEPEPPIRPQGVQPFDARPFRSAKRSDQPNPKDYLRNLEHQRLLEAGQTAEAEALALSGSDRVLVILVEFAGSDVITWTAPITPTDPTSGSQWDPYGIADYDQFTGVWGDCSNIITQTTVFTYHGPLHNMIERPLSTTDRSGTSIWSTDFSPEWFEGFMFGNGVEISFTYQSGESMYASFAGQSVADYYSDISSGIYTITGDVVGWVGVPHSTWWYGADACPGARSDPSASGADADDSIPGAGTYRTLVYDAVDAVNAISDTIPGFDWANYDLDGDGVVDRLWIVHAGYGEEDATPLLNRDPVTGTQRTAPVPEYFYGESAVWSHSSGGRAYSVTQDIAIGPYIMMPENGGIGVFAHEYGHNLGADDMYAYDHGYTSAGFWTLMGDDWTGHPIGFEPPAVDPYHLDQFWGWLDPYIITEAGPDECHEVTLGQASRFADNTATGDVYRGAKIDLGGGVLNQPVPVWQGDYYWWGGQSNLANAMMTTVDPIDLSAATAATLTFDLVYDIEDEWDFLWVQVSTDGVTWPYSNTLTNANTQCVHDPNWIGEANGFPEDVCGAGIGGFYGYNANWPDPETQVFDLSAYVGESVYLRFWYMTDWATLYSGAFVDNVEVTTDAGSAFFDDAEMGDAKWTYAAPWQRNGGKQEFTHNYYLQWRNVNENGGYDSALGDERWRFGPANTGLLVWYNNNFYIDNEIYHYLEDDYSFGPKGVMLVVDSHPMPYKDPNLPAHSWLGDENSNVTTRMQMRDATFTLQDTVDFTMTVGGAFIVSDTHFLGRPAVSAFNDAMGYYPGVEDAGDGTYWQTVDWDTSVAIPALDTYSVAGGPAYPGYHVQYIGDYRDPVGWYGFWSGGYGGTGNPGDENVQLGWQFELIEEAADHTWGKVRICNVQPLETSYEPKEISTAGVSYLTYTVTLNNEGSLPQSRWFTFTLDPLMTFVSASWAPTGTLEFPTYGWAGEVPTDTSMSFTLVASIDVSLGTLQVPGGMDVTTTFEHNDFMNPVYVEDMVTHIERMFIHLPIVMRNFAGTVVVP